MGPIYVYIYRERGGGMHVALVWALPTPQLMPTVGSRRISPHLVSNRESREWKFQVPRSELVCKSYGSWKWRPVSFIICCDCIRPLSLMVNIF